jgi:PAS domain S-box-containing protein
MNRLFQASRIVWLVRALTSTGLLTVAVIVAIFGWRLVGVRTERQRATETQRRLDQTSSTLRQMAIESRAAILATLDETATLPKPGSAANLVQFIQWETHSHPDDASVSDTSVTTSLNQVGSQASNLAELSTMADAWRGKYDVVWDDIQRQKTIGKVRNQIAQLRNAVDQLDGRHRLAEASRFRQWRQASGNDATKLAASILLDQARQQSHDTTDFKNMLSEFARLVEVLDGVQSFDTLADLKDNQFKPLINSLGRAFDNVAAGDSSRAEADAVGITAQSIEILEAAVFGAGFISDAAHPTIQVGSGGLYGLYHNTLELRRERAVLVSKLAAASQQMDAGIADFARLAQERIVALTQQLENDLKKSLQQMFILGGFCSALFLWLAWMISRGIRSQVAAIEQASVESEKGRRIAHELMLKQQASERRFRTLSNSAPLGIFEADAVGGIAYANPQWESISGLTVPQSLGAGWQTALHPTDAGEVIAEWKKATSEGGEFNREFRFRTAEEQGRWVSVRLATILAENRDVLGYVGTVEDITERKRAEAELETANRNLLEATRRAGMAEIATSVLHNVGNVLNSVNVSVSTATGRLLNAPVKDLTCAVQMMTQRKDDLGEFLTQDERGRQIPGFLEAAMEVMSVEQKALLDEMACLARNVEHIKEIVRVQQTHARSGNVKEQIKVVGLIEDALRVNLVGGTENAAIEVVREFEADPILLGDRHAILQVLINLVSNAKHAIAGNGRPEKRLTIRTSLEHRDGDEFFVVCVTDNGIGIEPANLTRIFNHGFTTRKDGHGFGLHWSANTARQLGGSLTARSDGPGAGATFVFLIPVAKEVASS